MSIERVLALTKLIELIDSDKRFQEKRRDARVYRGAGMQSPGQAKCVREVAEGMIKRSRYVAELHRLSKEPSE